MVHIYVTFGVYHILAIGVLALVLYSVRFSRCSEQHFISLVIGFQRMASTLVSMRLSNWARMHPGSFEGVCVTSMHHKGRFNVKVANHSLCIYHIISTHVYTHAFQPLQRKRFIVQSIHHITSNRLHLDRGCKYIRRPSAHYRRRRRRYRPSFPPTSPVWRSLPFRIFWISAKDSCDTVD